MGLDTKVLAVYRCFKEGETDGAKCLNATLHISIRSWAGNYSKDFSIQLSVVVVGRRCTTASNSHRFPKIMPPKSLDGDSARDYTISRAKDGKGPFNQTRSLRK